ncbi:MAG TPA: hypothetical protein VFL63_00345 [Rhodanobacteraceae bacterium]|nr:hypothetical protein [Rhodanobacteraceae bacterium]
MNKSNAARWTETINYLNTAFPNAVPKIGDHINTIVTLTQDAISKEIALGSTPGVHKNTTANKPARNALRALLLCQRVYFSDLWAKMSMVGGATAHASYLPTNWKALSLGHWGMQTEASIREGIGMFATVAGATADDVSDVAKTGAPSGAPPPIAGNLTLSRNNFPLTGPSETCYRGVLAWLLKSGVVSLRWFMRNPGPTGEAALDELFGTGEAVWLPGRPFKDSSVLPTIPKGFVVHMWMEDSGTGGWNGHWVISNGDGTICGVNNGEVNNPPEVVIKAYTNSGKLRSQFEGYAELVKEVRNERGFLDIVSTGKAARARMVKFDPLTLPGRM